MKVAIIAVLTMITAVFAQAQLLPIDVAAKNAVSVVFGSSKVGKVVTEKIVGGELNNKYNLIVNYILHPKEDCYNSERTLSVVLPSLDPLVKRLSMDKTFDDIQMITIVAKRKKDKRIALNISLWREDLENVDWSSATPESIIQVATKRGFYKPL